MLSVTREFLKFKQHFNMLLRFNEIDPYDPMTGLRHLPYPFTDNDIDSEEVKYLQRNFCYFTGLQDVFNEWDRSKKLSNKSLTILYRALFQPKCDTQSLHHFTIIFLYVALTNGVIGFGNPNTRTRDDIQKILDQYVRNLGKMCKDYQMVFTQAYLRETK